MNLKTKKALLLLLPLLVGGGAIYAMNRRNALPGLKAPDPQKLTDVPTTDKVKPSSLFPLRKGTINDKVKELQRAIGLTGDDIDGKFGTQTESKLLAYAGVMEVKDQAQLDQIKQMAIGISNKARAESLLTAFQKGGMAMMCTKSCDAQLVLEDYAGALTYMPKYLPLVNGKTYNNQDYILVKVTKLGNLIFEINKGTLQGLYAVDPNKVSLSKV